MATDPEPWDFQSGIDNSTSWAAFEYYRALPHPRKLRDVAQVFNVSYGAVAGWANDGLWRDRALAWDRHLSTIQKEVVEDATRETAAEMAERHGDMLRKSFDLVERELGKMHKESIDSPGAMLLRPKELLQFQDTVVKLERLVKGQATDITKDAEDLDLSKLSDQELEELDRLRRKARP